MDDLISANAALLSPKGSSIAEFSLCGCALKNRV